MSHVFLTQYTETDGTRAVAIREGDAGAHKLNGVTSIRALALSAIASGTSLADTARAAAGEPVDLFAAQAEGRLLAPIEHDDPAHLIVTGTGLTHLGSAEGRDQMHRSAKQDPDSLTDSMKMFLMGVEDGKPETLPGCQPEWFYKGNGDTLVGTGQPLLSPAFALDAGEEPEIAGVYLIGPDGTPLRLGFALGNEFSDHVTERGNYLWLAHSKLRHAAIGAELLVGDPPADVRGTSRILRDGAVLWEKPFLSGEDNMSHAIANLEHHHFKYGLFRSPGDVHVHFFGTATASFADGIQTRPGDVFEIEAAPFALKLANPIAAAEHEPVRVKQL